ncbi:MAG: hypothetical protein LBC02_14990 [Planctomycetaceae bacterium]|jgi:hypothetical protein|nr:hypothetical protein [Planctomycetaceae bacterium]
MTSITDILGLNENLTETVAEEKYPKMKHISRDLFWVTTISGSSIAVSLFVFFFINSLAIPVIALTAIIHVGLFMEIVLFFLNIIQEFFDLKRSEEQQIRRQRELSEQILEKLNNQQPPTH